MQISLYKSLIGHLSHDNPQHIRPILHKAPEQGQLNAILYFFHFWVIPPKVVTFSPCFLLIVLQPIPALCGSKILFSFESSCVLWKKLEWKRLSLWIGVLYTQNELRYDVSFIDCLIDCNFGCQNSSWFVLGNKSFSPTCHWVFCFTQWHVSFLLVLMYILSELKRKNFKI